VSTRSRTCLEVGRFGYMGMMLVYVMSMLIWLYYVCRNYMYTYAYPYIYIYIQCAILYKYGFCSTVGSWSWSICCYIRCYDNSGRTFTVSPLDITKQNRCGSEESKERMRNNVGYNKSVNKQME